MPAPKRASSASCCTTGKQRPAFVAPWGVLSLIKKYGTAAVEDACAAALDIGVYEYRFVRRYLERRPHPQMFLRQMDPLIRELTVCRDFINLKIKEQPE
jgi:hypothetical protein